MFGPTGRVVFGLGQGARDMRGRFAIAGIALIVGIAIGGFGVWFYTGFQLFGWSRSIPSDKALSAFSSADLGEKLLGDIGRSFVADRRAPNLSDGVVFYDTPQPYGAA